MLLKASFCGEQQIQKNLNEMAPGAVFMDEDGQLVAGELILGEARAAARGNDEAIESLVKQHARLVYRIAYAVLRNHQDAEDAVQETFLRVLRYSRGMPSVENPKTWLARIAWRVSVDRSERVRGKREVSLDGPGTTPEEFSAPGVAADEVMHSARLGAEVKKLIATLPTKLREPLILSTVEEMSPREVGAVLGINEAAVRSRVFRARAIVREKLAAQMGWR